MPASTPPFWTRLGFFVRYIYQERLYHQIVLLALANMMLIIPSFIIHFMVSALLFLTIYKLAFEVLYTVSMGELSYHDRSTFDLPDNIGFLAMAMPILQLLIYLFLYRYDPGSGLVLLIFTLVATPAYLMLLSQTQNVWTALNPLDLISVMTRVGFEYILLAVFFIALGMFNMWLRTMTGEWLPGITGVVLSALVFYFLIVYGFVAIGYVMYRHADTLGHETIDTETIDTQSPAQIDPMVNRIKNLLQQKQAQQVIDIIEDLSDHQSRPDLWAYREQAKALLKEQQRHSPAEQLSNWVSQGEMKRALSLYKSYLEDGHHIKPLDPEPINQLIGYARDRHDNQMVIKMVKGYDQRYPMEHQSIVDHFFLVAKIQCENKKFKPAANLLESVIKKYHHTARTRALSSYLKGIRMQHPDL